MNFAKSFTSHKDYKIHLTQIRNNKKQVNNKNMINVSPVVLNMLKNNNADTRKLSHVVVLGTFLLTWSTFQTTVST